MSLVNLVARENSKPNLNWQNGARPKELKNEANSVVQRRTEQGSRLKTQSFARPRKYRAVAGRPRGVRVRPREKGRLA
jgi:hypothetical protein